MSEAPRPPRRGRRGRPWTAPGETGRRRDAMARASWVGAVRRGVRGVRGDVGTLPRLTMKDLEEMAVERTETRGRMYQALTAILMVREGIELDAATTRGNARGSSDGAGGASKRRAKGKVSKAKKRSRTDE